MNKNYAFFLILLLFTEWGFAQRRVPSKAHKVRCFTVQSMQAARKRNPNMITDGQFENWLQEKNNARKVAMKHVFGANTELGTINNYTLPIVFHIIHSGEAVGSSSNVSRDLVNKQVMQLNKDYANLSGSPYAAASKTGIQFALATKSPTGATLAEPGIDRISYKTKKFTAPPYDDENYYITDVIKPATIWDPSKYLNIWVMDMSASGVLGFAIFPSTTLIDGLNVSEPETNTNAGVVIDPTTLGNIFATSDCGGSSTTAYSLGRTLTHELGHFFGLRHIWGDDNCGTDFCEDTPIHEMDNYGKPAHPKPNSCGTADEMFENYMDYTDDQVTNTFTLNQVERIQTIMQNSVRRKSLATSSVPTVAPTASNVIAFANCTGATTVVETAPAGSNRYKDISLPIVVENAATGAATLSISTSGSAIQGVDYQLLTPTVTFSAGDYTQNLIVRILDNNKVDGKRTLGLSYTISGSGVTGANIAQTMTITINDDDDIIVGQNTIKLLDESFNAGTLPAGWSPDADATNRFVVGTRGSYGNNAYVTRNATTKLNQYTNSVGYALLETPVIDATRVKTLGNLQFKYTVKGLTYNYDDSTGVTTGHYGLSMFGLDNDPNRNLSFFGFKSGQAGFGPYSNSSTAISGAPSLSASFLNNTRFHVDFYWNVENADSTANNPGFNIDDVIITATPFPVESNLGNSYSYALTANKTHNFRSTNTNALLQIANVTIPVADVTASVSEAGSSRIALKTLDGTFLRSQKVFTISNPSNNQAVQYSATFYFTDAEVAAWGNAATALKVIHLKSGSFNNTLSDAEAVLLKPTVTDNRTNNGYIAYTVTTTGLGSFALVDTATTLPVSLVSFKGSISNGEAILVWNTANEVNNKGFSIQRSTDGIAFNAIGFVASGNESAYSFVDKTIKKGSRYYYRLVQTDNNGTLSYSTTISLVYIDGNRSVSVLPNPFKHNLTIKNTGTDRSVLGIVITDINGRTMYTHTHFSTSSLDINTANWSKGAYLVRIMSGTSINVLKIVKE